MNIRMSQMFAPARTAQILPDKAVAFAEAMEGWCPWRESNPHSFRSAILSRVRLPVPPHGQRGVIYIVAVRPANPWILARKDLGPQGPAFR